MSEIVTIDPPISIIPAGEKKPLIISTGAELTLLASQEQGAWQRLAGNHTNLHMGINNAVSAQINWANSLLQNANVFVNQNGNPNGVTALANVRNLLERVKTNAILSQSKRGTEILNLAADDTAAAAIRLTSYAGNLGQHQPQQTDLLLTRSAIKEYIAGLDLKRSIKNYDDLFERQRQEFQQTIDDSRSASEAINTEMAAVVASASENRNQIEEKGGQLIQSLEESFKTALAQITKDTETAGATIRQLQDKTEEDVANFRAALRSELRLQAPTTYWRKKGDEHSKVVALSFSAFVISTAFIIIGLLHYGSSLVQALPREKDGSIFIGEIVVLTIPALAYFWFMRYLGRFVIVNQAAAADARLRATMTETFLALAADGQSGIADTERLVILQAIFRSNAAGADDDAAPPNLTDLLSAVAKAKT